MATSGQFAPLVPGDVNAYLRRQHAAEREFEFCMFMDRNRDEERRLAQKNSKTTGEEKTTARAENEKNTDTQKE